MSFRDNSARGMSTISGYPDICIIWDLRERSGSVASVVASLLFGFEVIVCQSEFRQEGPLWS